MPGGLNLAAERISVCEQQLAVTLIFWFEIVIVELIHTEFGQFEYGKANSNWFIEHDFFVGQLGP